MIKEFYDAVINSSEKEYSILNRLGIKISSFLIDRSKKDDIVGKIDEFGVFQIVLFYRYRVVPYNEKFFNHKKISLLKSIEVSELIDDFEDDYSNLDKLEGQIVSYSFEIVNNKDLEEIVEIHNSLKNQTLSKFYFQKMITKAQLLLRKQAIAR